jgi:hypothetical protein
MHTYAEKKIRCPEKMVACYLMRMICFFLVLNSAPNLGRQMCDNGACLQYKSLHFLDDHAIKNKKTGISRKLSPV